MAVDFKPMMLSLPTELIAKIDRAMDAGEIGDRDAFVADAIRHELAAIERASVDAAFAGMADDADYESEALRLGEEFSDSDWEALLLAEAR